MRTVICQYCSIPARLTDSVEVYGRSYGVIWLCDKCGAYVGCHESSKTHAPLGRLANAELRTLKIAAHAAFDPLWQRKMVRDQCSKSKARKAGYRWLAKEMGIEFKHCHIGFFNEDQCRQAAEICRRYTLDRGR